ncbi:MAG: IS630 transposase-related protein [Syntrophomonadaceae bacterium]|nr:IS630 transposase-related protein [Syntrophomonadaceae bacterium]
MRQTRKRKVDSGEFKHFIEENSDAYLRESAGKIFKK